MEKLSSVLNKTLSKLHANKVITMLLLTVLTCSSFFISIDKLGITSLGGENNAVVGKTGDAVFFDRTSGSGSVKTFVAAEVPILMVSLDTQNGPYLSMTNGYEDMITHYSNWLPTSGELSTEIAIVSDKAASHINANSANDTIKLAWYHSGADHMLMSSGAENGWQNSILTQFNGAGDGADPTGGAGVYRAKLQELKDAGNLRDWRTLVTDATIAQSKKVWGSFATTTYTGHSYSWDVSNKIRNYMQLQGLDIDNVASWSAEDSNKASIAYMDLLMTLYGCSTGTPYNAVEWEAAVDRYINNGFQPGTWKCNENIIIYPGIAMQVNGDKGDRIVMSCGDAWNYAYHVNPEFSLGNKAVAFDKYGNIGSDVYQRLFVSTTDNHAAYPNSAPYLNVNGFSYCINFGFAKKVKLSNWQLETVDNTRRFVESLYMDGKDGTNYYGINVIPALPMEITPNTSKFNIDFDVLWADKRGKHLVSTGQTVNDVAQIRVNMKVPESEKGTWETIFEKYTDFEIAFDIKSNNDTGRVTRTTKTDGGQTSTLSAPGYQIDGKDYVVGSKVKIEKARLKSLLWGNTTFDSLYERTTKPQIINYAELQQYGYDLSVTIYYKNATSTGSSAKSDIVGYTKDATDGQRAKHKVTAYREEDPNRKVTYYSDPEAFAEIKEGTVDRNDTGSTETWEAMAGVPTTETLYFTSGGSEFIVELELEHVEGEKAERKYRQTFFGTECEFKRGDQFKPIKASGASTDSSFNHVPTIAPKEKFTTDLNGFDTGTVEEKEAEWYQGVIPSGAASYTVDLQGHTDTPKKEDGTSVVTGSTYAKDNENMASTTITALWTGKIVNSQGTKSEQAPGSSHIKGFKEANTAPTEHGGKVGAAGDFNETDTSWNDEAYKTALKQAEQWAKAYEKTNETYTAKKLSTGDQNTRIWKIGNATISVQFSGGTSNQGAGNRPAGNYNTGNVKNAYDTSPTSPSYWGYNFSFAHGFDGSTGTHSEDDGPPPTHEDSDGSPTVGSTVNGVGDITYTIKVTFDNGTMDAHELCGPCCQHNLPQVFDSWKQKSQYDYARINTMRVFKIHRSYVNDMEEITFVDYKDPEDLGHSEKDVLIQDLSKGVPWMHGALSEKAKVLSPAQQAEKHNGTDTIVAAISQGDPNIFYNIANEADYYAETSGANKLAENPSRAGRLRYSFQPQEHDESYLEEICRRGNTTWTGYGCEEGSRSNKCDGLMRTISSQNPVKVVGQGHELPIVNETAGLYEGTINRNCYANGILYTNDDNPDDQTWMETLTQTDTPSCNSVLVPGTVETAGKGKKKTAYSKDTIDDKDYLTEEYHRMRYRRNMTTDIFVVSDMLILQTSTGDQPVMYYVAPKQTKRLQQHFDYNEADVADNPGGEPVKGALLKNDFANMWSKNPNCANNWGPNNLGQDGDVNVGSYLGLGDKDPNNKFSDTSKHTFQFGTIFDNTGNVKAKGDMDTGCGHILRFQDGEYEAYALTAEFGANKHKATDKFEGRKSEGYEPYSETVTPGGKLYWGVDNKIDWVDTRPGGYGSGWRNFTDSWYVASPSMRYHDETEPNSYYLAGERRKQRVYGLRIFTDEIRQDPTNINKEYITGEAKQTYQLIKDYDKSTNFVHEFDVEDIYAWDEDDGKVVDGFILDAPYTRDDTKVNDIVVQNPVSVESAAVVHRLERDGGDYSYDTRSDNELAGAQGLKDFIDGLDVCPGVADLCDFRVLNCSYDTDKVLFSSNFEPNNIINGKTVETVYNKTGADGVTKTYVVNTTNSDYRYSLPNGFTVSNEKIKYQSSAYDVETGKTEVKDYWLPVFGDNNNDTNNPKGDNHYLKCYGTRWSLPLSDLQLGTYNANTKLAVEFDFYMPGYTDKGTMLVSFNGYDFYIPANQTLATWNTGVGVEKQVKNKSFVGSKMHLKLMFDFKDATQSKLYINNEELRGDQYRLVSESNAITSSLIGSYLNIGSWNKSDDFAAKFYIDNLKIVKIAGDRFHTDACYKDLQQHEPAIQYSCQSLETFEYNKAAGGQPELYVIPTSGRYKIETYGAQGGGTDNQSIGSHAGLGGYSYGFRHFDKGQKVLVYAGGSGSESKGSNTEYFWVLTPTECGNSSAWNNTYPETMSGINYINSVTGKQEVTNGTMHGVWAETLPGGFTCGAHSVSVAINNSTGKMVSRVKQPTSGFKDGVNTFDYNYTGTTQTFTAPVPGTYTFEVFGAQGGNDGQIGGKGGYAKGSYVLKQGETININVGGAGTGGTNAAGGWNGGGRSGNAGSSGSGGGASDIRVGGNGLGNRIIVAGGGGGGGSASAGEPGGVGGNNNVLGVGSDHTYLNVNLPGTCTCYHCNNPSCPEYCSNHRYACKLDCTVKYPNKGSDGGGGGGGYYGGAARNGDEGGYGGSNYIGGVTNGIVQNGTRVGNGFVRIYTPNISTIKYPTTSSAGWNGGGYGGLAGFGGGGATDIRLLNYGGIFSIGEGMGETTDTDGGLTYGPYIAAGKGHYQADIYGKGLNKCTFDAYTNKHAADTYKITDIKVSDTHATLYFEVTDDLEAGGTGLEVRVHHGGVYDYAFDKLYVSRLEDRIIVGGGGGGADNGGGSLGGNDDGSGGYGGGLIAGNASVDGKLTVPGKALTDELQAQVDTIKNDIGAWNAIDGIAKSGCGLGAGQNYGYALGFGESISFNTDTGGAGGGYYGGYVTNHNNGGAGGGSGYVDGLQKGVSTGNSNPGDGVATIHMLNHEANEAVGNKLMATYDYTGNVQEFTAQVAGNYMFETWGAAGGDGRIVNTTRVIPETGGAGAYASGTKYLAAGQTVYVYVGGKGGSSSGAPLSRGAGGWNGGGTGGTELSGENLPESGAGGGGATDVRTSKGTLSSRFIVAAGGGGAGDHLGETTSDLQGLITKKEDGVTWARVLYQDISGNKNYFTASNMGRVNQTGLFSCLDRLEDFRGADGKFTFMLDYPDATGPFAGVANKWKQSSNPYTGQRTNSTKYDIEYDIKYDESGKEISKTEISRTEKKGDNAEGYEEIYYPMTSDIYGRGLEYNGISCVLDGSVNHGNWWLCCGIMNNSYSGTNTSSKPYTMPGPTQAGTGNQGVSKCELWVAVPGSEQGNIAGGPGGASASTGRARDKFCGGEGGTEVGLTYNTYNKGGTQSYKTLGVGQDGYSHNGGKNYGSYGGGGGGYYGGYWEGERASSEALGGAGGSSYVGGVDEGVQIAGTGVMANPRAKEASNMTGNRGNGYVRVWLKNESTAGHTSECAFISNLNNTHVHNRSCLSETNRALVSALNAEWGGSHYLIKSMLGDTVFNKLTNPSSVYTIGGFTKTDYKQLSFTDCSVIDVKDSKLYVSNFGANPHAGVNVNIAAGAVTRIVMDIDIKNNPTTVGEIFWITDKDSNWGAAQSVQAKYDEKNKQYIFDVAGNPKWKDTIKSVSFDFIANNTPGGTAEIQSIAFIGSGSTEVFPEPTKLLKSYAGFTDDAHHGVEDAGRRITSFVGDYIQCTFNTVSSNGWDFKLPVNISSLEGIRFIKMRVINLSNSTMFGVDIKNDSQHYFSSPMIPNSDALQEIVIPVNWTGSTNAIWFDPAPGNYYTGSVKVASIELWGYGNITKEESTHKETGSQTFNADAIQKLFVAPYNATYTFEVWGAQGGGTLSGKGGYAKGDYYLNKGQSLLVSVGQQGSKRTGGAYVFNYTGNVQTFTAPVSGEYMFEAWGASGGGSLAGQGGYTIGTTYLNAGQTIYVYVGQQGVRTSGSGEDTAHTGTKPSPATFNGGGDGGYGMYNWGYHLGGSGGGATDFRLVGGAWNNTAGLQSRIIVAGGGGGSGCASNHNQGHGGGLQGAGTLNSTGTYAGAATTGGSQTQGGYGSGKFSYKETGSFGVGAGAAQCAAGGGGGYYGGGSEYTAGGSGGSSFVTGYPGCDTTYRAKQGGFNFKNVTLLQGGQTGNGVARITQLNTNSPSSGQSSGGFNGGGTGGLNAFGGGGATDISNSYSVATAGNNVGSSNYTGQISGTSWVLANSGDTVHIHTGHTGIPNSSNGKVWRVDVYGTNVDQLRMKLSYHNGTNWVANGGTVESTTAINLGSTMVGQYYVKANTSYPALAFCFDHPVSSPTTIINQIVVTDMSTRVIVAGGGGGSADYVHGETYAGNQGGYGGGTTGGTAGIEGNDGVNRIPALGGTQTAGGRGAINKTTYPNNGQDGGFGYGGSGISINGHNGGGAGGGYYGGGSGSAWYQGGGAGGSSYTGKVANGVTTPNVTVGHGKAVISYKYDVYDPATIVGKSPNILKAAYKSSFAGLDGTQEGIINAINAIAAYIDEIPDPVGGEFNAIFNCSRTYNTHICTDACNEATRVLDCQEPHHYGMHYTKATSDHASCYEPCLDDTKHKIHNHQLIDVDGKHIEESIYINTDEYYAIFFPNVGDFYESDLHGIGATTQTRGMSYVDQMQTSKWTREKYVKFSFDCLFYREETKLWEQYKAGTWIELPVKGEGYPYYNFYCTLNNSEIAAAHVEFACEGINAKRGKGKYNYKNWQGLSDEPDDEVNADDWVFKNINGKPTASNHENNNDNPREETNKDRESTLTSLHGAHRDTYVDVVGRIGNLAITDSDDFRWCNMFKVPKNDGTWIVDGIVQEVIESKQNNYLSWHYNNGALAKDIRNRLVSKQKGMYNTWGTQAWKGSGDDAATALGLPLGSVDSIANNPAPLERDLLKPGYNINFEVTTTGNYQQYLQVKPYFYALCVKNDGIHTEGTMYPVDVHMNTEEGYKPINLFGAVDDTATWNKYKDQIYDYVISLNWDEEFVRRNYDATEQAVTENMAKIYKVQDGDGDKPLPIPNGRYYALGTAQIMRAEGNARTFIGSEHTIRESFNAKTTDNTNFDKLFYETDYEFKAQRWHLKLGIPSSTVFTFYDEKTGERHNALDEITWNNQKMKAYEPISESGKYVIVMTANIKALGETWNLYYTQADGDNDAANVSYDNGVIKLNGKNYIFDDYIGPIRINMDDVKMEDLRKRIVARTGKNINSSEVNQLAQEEYDKILEERRRAQNRVIIGVYDASDTSQVDVDIIGTH